MPRVFPPYTFGCCITAAPESWKLQGSAEGATSKDKEGKARARAVSNAPTSELASDYRVQQGESMRVRDAGVREERAACISIERSSNADAAAAAAAEFEGMEQ